MWGGGGGGEGGGLLTPFFIYRSPREEENYMWPLPTHAGARKIMSIITKSFSL